MKGTKGILQSVLVILGVVILEGIADQIQPLVRLTNDLAERPEPYRTTAIVMAVAGGLLFAASMIVYFVLTREKWQKAIQKGALQVRADYSAEQILTLHEIKYAYRSGQWLRDRGWIAFSLVVLGALVMMVGLFGLFVVIGTPGIKLLALGLFVYIVARTAWGFAKA